MPESSKGSEMFISDTRVSCTRPNAEWTLGPDLLLLGTNICFVKWWVTQNLPCLEWIHGHKSGMRKYFLDCCFICPLLVTIVPNYSFWLVSQYFFLILSIFVKVILSSNLFHVKPNLKQVKFCYLYPCQMSRQKIPKPELFCSLVFDSCK